MRLILPLTDDLDRVSEELFALKTNGGDEYCGWVIRDAVNRLDWSRSRDVYKAIFIAGNEPFTQGSVDFHGSCRAAIERGILVNTIFCGASAEGRQTGWKDGAVLADGRYHEHRPEPENRRDPDSAGCRDRQARRRAEQDVSPLW